MSLSVALNAAVSGLKATQAGIEVTSRNISNTATPGYTRKHLPQETLVIGGQGAGVWLGEVERNVSAQMQRDIRGNNTKTDLLAVQSDYLDRLQTLLGQPGEANSLGNLAGNLGDAFRQLSTSPDVLTAQTTVISRAEQFADGLNQLADGVQALRTEAEQAIDATVESINSDLAAIYDLNKLIASRRAVGDSTADLEDKRDGFINNISKNIDINYFTRENGEIWMMTQSGRPLLDTAVQELSFNAVPQVSAGLAYPATLDGVMSGLDDITLDIRGGKLKGLLELRDTILPQAQLQLDSYAATVTQLFTAQNIRLFDDSGAAFLPANTTGFANRISVNAAVISDPWRTRDGTVVAAESANKGDATLPLAIVDMFEQLQTFPATTGLGTSFTIAGYAASFVTFQGTQSANMTDKYNNQSTLTEALQARFDNDTGVNSDQEMATLIELQAAYAANARMITAVRDMFDILINSV